MGKHPESQGKTLKKVWVDSWLWAHGPMGPWADTRPDTEAHVGSKNLDFPDVFQAKVAWPTGRHGAPRLPPGLKKPLEPHQQSCLGNYLYFNKAF